MNNLIESTTYMLLYIMVKKRLMEFDLDMKSVSWVQWMHTHLEIHGDDQFKDPFTVESSDKENLLYKKVTSLLPTFK